MDIRDVQGELFRLEYPHLHAGSDPDIERYCYLRDTGQDRAALAVYQLRIRPRYPDETLRMALLRSYRRRDPLFPRLLEVGYRRLTDRALERVRRIIGYISRRVGAYNQQNVYATIKTAEDILRFFPRERYEAISAIDRMYRYARVLDYQVAPMEQAAELVRSYLFRSLPILENERERRLVLQRKTWDMAEGTRDDLSRVVFSGADLARIEIPSRFVQVEDQTLAYCMKYWNLIQDAAFEQILSLYSRKYGKKNHAVYLAIRQGRRANHRDEDILSSVMSLLVSGYYYSLRGDRYLQQGWRHIKDAMEKTAKVAAPRAIAAPAALAPAPAPTVAAARTPPAAPAPAPATAATPGATAPKAAAPRAIAAPQAATPRAIPKTAAPQAATVAPAPATTVTVPKAAAPKAITAPAPPPGAPAPAASKPPARKFPLFGAKTSPARPPPSTGGSVSDRLRKLSGRGYDLYQNRFLAHARPAIRKVLRTGRSVFFPVPEKAEDLVYQYLRDHYADPYMNWAESEERRLLAKQGFDLPSLDPVIDECFRKIK